MIKFLLASLLLTIVCLICFRKHLNNRTLSLNEKYKQIKKDKENYD